MDAALNTATREQFAQEMVAYFNGLVETGHTYSDAMSIASAQIEIEIEALEEAAYAAVSAARLATMHS